MTTSDTFPVKAVPVAADEPTMKCSRCKADAVRRSGDTYYCGRCSVQVEWQTLIAALQDARVDAPVAGEPLPSSV